MWPIQTESQTAPARQFLMEIVRALWSSKLMRVAVACVVFGVASWFWNRSASTGPSARDAHGLPLTLRLGAGYAGGFFVGLAFRWYVKFSLWALAALLAGIAALRATGCVDLDWTAVSTSVRESIAWANGQAEALKAFLSGYLPSAGAGGFGLWRGFRWNRATPPDEAGGESSQSPPV